MANICIYGASSMTLDKIFYAEAEKLGGLLAQSGFGIVFGGQDRGLMGAVARGVKSFGGWVTGVIPSFMGADIFEQYDELIETETLRQRKQAMEDHAEGFIALPGGIGTFEELFEILTLKQLGCHDKPVAILNTASYYDALLGALGTATLKNFAPQALQDSYFVAETPEDAVAYIKRSVRI
ncbi:MAG: TIGR00730 family Rossman fold protein [Christensenellaceae bacterium]